MSLNCHAGKRGKTLFGNLQNMGLPEIPWKNSTSEPCSLLRNMNRELRLASGLLIICELAIVTASQGTRTSLRRNKRFCQISISVSFTLYYEYCFLILRYYIQVDTLWPDMHVATNSSSHNF